jgi:phosphate transport system permease protein
MKARSIAQRRTLNIAVNVVSTLASLTGIFFLAWILLEVLKRGLSGMSFAFFTQLPTPPGTSGGGVANAILGTFYMTALATIIGIPIGMFAGIFLGELGVRSRLAAWVRFSANALIGVPSIIIGMFVYAILVSPMGHFSGYAGALALAIIMIPIVARTTEDMLQLVPSALRESALALAVPRWRVTLDIVFRAAKSGLLTGVLLAVARVSGETAPLLFTALNNPDWVESLNEPTANLTVTVFNYAMSPYPDWQAAAWAASLLVMVGVLALMILARILIAKGKR